MAKEKAQTMDEFLKQGKENTKAFKKRLKQSNEDHADRVEELEADLEGQKKKK